MYSLVIVEDEFTTRRALVHMVNWQELGFCVEGEFADGQELFDYLKRNTPDVILTDIKMTSVGGIEIARLVAEQNLPIQVVFLSAYKDFSYAQEAVEYNVAHYLLKPIELSKLREVFRKLKEMLDKQVMQENMIQDREEHYERLINYERQQFVTDAYFGALADPDKKASRLGLISRNQENGSRLILNKVVLENDQEYLDFIAEYGEQELQDRLERVLCIFHDDLEYYPITWGVSKEEKPFLLGVFWENESSGQQCYGKAQLEDTIGELLGLHADIPIFKVLTSSSELVHYAGALGKQRREEDFEQDGEYLQLLREQNKLLCSYLNQNSAEQGLKLTETLFDNYIQGGAAFAKRMSIYTVTKLLDEVAMGDLIEWNGMFSRCVPASFFSDMQYQDLKEGLVGGVRLLFRYMQQKTAPKEDSSIEKIQNYLHSHYCEDITLNQIAEVLFLNPAYISRLVKEQTGKNYTELVMEMRIEKAVELLKNTDMYVYEIADKVGYKNLKYFYRVFHKIVGKTPSDYRP